MSSRTSPQRKRNLPGPIINATIQMPSDKGSEKPKATSIETLWSVVGFSSVVTAILFIMGWSFTSNWYGYYGIGMEEVNIPLQQILIQSIPALIFIFLILSFAAYLTNLLILFTFGGIPPFTGPKPKPIDKWNSLLPTFLIYAYIFVSYLLYSQIGLKLDLKSLGQSLVGKGPLPAEFGYTTLLIIGAYVLRPVLDKYFDRPIFDLINPTFLLNFLVALFIGLLISSSLALSAAIEGRRPNGSKIQLVFLVTSKPITVLKDVERYCDSTNCAYGPFGMIGENDKSFFLVKGGNYQSITVKNPELYIMPRNDYLVIPASAPIPTVIPQPTPTIAVTPTP